MSTTREACATAFIVVTKLRAEEESIYSRKGVIGILSNWAYSKKNGCRSGKNTREKSELEKLEWCGIIFCIFGCDMIFENKLSNYHDAAKMIETDGIEAYHTVSERFGNDIASALLIAHIRRNLGSMDTFPAKEEVVSQTNEILNKHGLVSEQISEEIRLISQNAFIVQRTYAELIISLRHKVLRPGLPIETADFEGDGDQDTRHFAVFEPYGLDPLSCASFYLNSFENEKAWQLRGMATEKFCRGKGLGRLLLESSEKMLRAEFEFGVQLLWCNARIEAVPFYEKMGWQCVSDIFEIEGVGPHRKMVKRLAG